MDSATMGRLLITDRGLATCSFPYLPRRASPSRISPTNLATCSFPYLPRRASPSRISPTNLKTFETLELWSEFEAGALAISQRLDDLDERNADPSNYWSDGLDEISVRGALEVILYPQINRLASKLGLSFGYRSGGSGRSLSLTDMVILDIQQQQAVNNLSARVFGNGEVQWELESMSFPQALNDPMSIEVLQQLFGDMVMDETAVGFVSSYNETVFLYRDPCQPSKLYYSPVVNIRDAPVEKFLFILEHAEKTRLWKSKLSRTALKEQTSIQIKTRGVGPLVNVYEEGNLADIPAYPLDELGVDGDIVAMGKFGNVLKARVNGVDLALKTFDLRKEAALKSFINEQVIYKHLQQLQGDVIPVLHLIGRLPHTFVVYLGLSRETCNDIQSCLRKQGKKAEKTILTALQAIHEQGVLHGDLSLWNVLYRSRPMRAKFIDFEYSELSASKAEINSEMRDMEELLVKAQD